MDLSTEYMGLALRNPLVASPSALSHTLDGIPRLADGGVGAIVMFSLFEEQMRKRAAQAYRLIDEPAESFPEALNSFPSVAEGDVGPQSYLDLLERAVSAVDIPVIASLNGSPKGPAKAWNPPGPGAGSAGRKPKLTARQSEGGSRHV
jgi:dihydroorotate dehydrogenase (fumarate)